MEYQVHQIAVYAEFWVHSYQPLTQLRASIKVKTRSEMPPRFGETHHPFRTIAVKRGATHKASESALLRAAGERDCSLLSDS